MAKVRLAQDERFLLSYRIVKRSALTAASACFLAPCSPVLTLPVHPFGSRTKLAVENAAILALLTISVALHAGPAQSVVLGSGATQADLESALRVGQPVIFRADVTITLTNGLTIATNASIDARGWTVTLDGQNRVRHFVVAPGARLRLIHLRLINGSYVGPPASQAVGDPGFGGSIYSDGGAVELIDCLFTNNNTVAGTGGLPAPPLPNGSPNGGSGGGGAVYCANGQVAITNCVFAANEATGGYGGGYPTYTGGHAYGGALYVTNSLILLSGTTFATNVAIGGRATFTGYPIAHAGTSHGGAVAQIGGTGTVSGAGAATAGALFHDGGLLEVAQTTFTNNSALGGEAPIGGPDVGYGGAAIGGAILNQSGLLQLRESAVVFNRAKGGPAPFFFLTPTFGGSADGGGIKNLGDLLVVNCTIAENEATAGEAENGRGRLWAEGGGMSGSAVLVNATVARNQVLPPDRSWSYGSALAGDFTLTNTILYCAAGQTNVSGHLVDGGHNLCSDDSASFSSPTSLGDVDPLLGPVADNGGLTPSIAISPRSRALNAGDAMACPRIDQRGVLRPAGAGSEIGAYELVPMLGLNFSLPGRLQLQCLSEPGATNRFNVSSDFRQWAELGAVISDPDGHSAIEDPQAYQLPHRFYEVR